MTPPRPSTIKAAAAFHTLLYRATRGRLGRRLGGHPVLLLTTTGRHSGRRHTVPLLYLREGADLVLIASFAGHDRHPAWYLNLKAAWRAVAQVEGERFPVIARDATLEERPRLWELAVAEYPGYAGYQKRTTRLIPLVLLRRA